MAGELKEFKIQVSQHGIDKVVSLINQLNAAIAKTEGATDRAKGGKDAVSRENVLAEAKKKNEKATVGLNRANRQSHATYQRLVRIQSEQIRRNAQLEKTLLRTRTQMARMVRTLRAQMSAMRGVNRSTREGYRNLLSYGASLDEAIFRVAKYTIALRILYGAVTAVTAGFSDLLQLQNQIAQLQKVLPPTTDFERFSQVAIQLAIKYGSTLENVTTALFKFAQQGLSATDTLKRTEAALLAVNAANLPLGDAINVITASLNIFGQEALNEIAIVDKLVAVQANYAVSTQDLFNAVQKFGPIVNMLGDSFDFLLGLETAVVAATRKTGAEVATAFKTILARVVRPDAVRSLENVGVAVKSSAGEFRTLQQILGDLALVWDDLSEVRQADLAQTLAGVRRREVLIALMGAFNVAIDAQATSMSANGEAMRAHEAQMGTYVTKWQQLKNELVALAKTFEGQFFGIVEGTIDLLSSLMKFVDSLAGRFVLWAATTGTLTLAMVGLYVALGNVTKVMLAFAGLKFASGFVALAIPLIKPFIVLASVIAAATIALKLFDEGSRKTFKSMKESADKAFGKVGLTGLTLGVQQGLIKIQRGIAAGLVDMNQFGDTAKGMLQSLSDAYTTTGDTGFESFKKINQSMLDQAEIYNILLAAVSQYNSLVEGAMEEARSGVDSLFKIAKELHRENIGGFITEEQVESLIKATGPLEMFGREIKDFWETNKKEGYDVVEITEKWGDEIVTIQTLFANSLGRGAVMDLRTFTDHLNTLAGEWITLNQTIRDQRVALLAANMGLSSSISTSDEWNKVREKLANEIGPNFLEVLDNEVKRYSELANKTEIQIAVEKKLIELRKELLDSQSGEVSVYSSLIEKMREYTRQKRVLQESTVFKIDLMEMKDSLKQMKDLVKARESFAKGALGKSGVFVFDLEGRKRVAVKNEEIKLEQQLQKLNLDRLDKDRRYTTLLSKDRSDAEEKERINLEFQLMMLYQQEFAIKELAKKSKEISLSDVERLYTMQKQNFELQTQYQRLSRTAGLISRGIGGSIDKLLEALGETDATIGKRLVRGLGQAVASFLNSIRQAFVENVANILSAELLKTGLPNQLRDSLQWGGDYLNAKIIEAIVEGAERSGLSTGKGMNVNIPQFEGRTGKALLQFANIFGGGLIGSAIKPGPGGTLGATAGSLAAPYLVERLRRIQGKALPEGVHGPPDPFHGSKALSIFSTAIPIVGGVIGSLLGGLFGDEEKRANEALKKATQLNTEAITRNNVLLENNNRLLALQNQLINVPATFSLPALGGGYGGSGGGGTTYSNVHHWNIQAAPGMSPSDIGDEIERRLQNSYRNDSRRSGYNTSRFGGG